jgi:hypothetical protein
MADTDILSFRILPKIKSRLDLASGEFQGHTPELLRMIFKRAVIEQDNNRGFLGWLFRHDNNQQLTAIGGTKVYAIRLSKPDLISIKDAAAQKGQNTSEWCAIAIETWFKSSFQPFYQKYGEDDSSWLTRYTLLYQEQFEEISAEHARKRSKLTSEIISKTG